MASQVVAVGVDGSEPSREALRYALAEATRRGATLRVISAFESPEYWAVVYGAPVGVSSDQLAEAVRAEVQAMIDQAVAEQPAPVRVELAVVAGSAVSVLLDASTRADLLVLGHRGRGELASMLLGSVGLRCALHASCPVTIVRPEVPAGQTDTQPTEGDLQRLGTATL
jgi:nucleotide-binding universal stress UspA family protein